MSRHTYTGTVEGQVYADYLDLAKGSTLVADPGQSYDIAGAPRELPNADGVHVPIALPVPPPDGNWADPQPERKPKKNTVEETG